MILTSHHRERLIESLIYCLEAHDRMKRQLNDMDVNKKDSDLLFDYKQSELEIQIYLNNVRIDSIRKAIANNEIDD